VLLGLHFGTWLPSLAFTSIAASTTIVTTVPVWVVLLVWATRGQRPSALTGVGVAIAIGGGALVALGDVDGLDAGSNPLLGNLLALAAAVTYSAHLLLGQAVQARGLGVWRWTTVVAGIGALAVAPLVVVTAPGEGPFPLRFWLAVLALCLVSQLVGHSSLTWSTRWISPTLVSVAILLEPVLASAGAAALYDEVPGPLVLLGAAVLIVGVALTTLAEQPSAPTPVDEPVGAP
jgi:drug/metabolite transporter (DMT)-like permease